MKTIKPKEIVKSIHQLLSPILPLTLGILSLTFTPPAIAQEQSLRTLTVTGQGSETIPTTLTQVQLGVEVEGPTAEEVQQEVARRSAAVVDLLRSRRVEKLQTTGIRLSPNYRYDNRIRRLVGYSATNIVSFRISTEQAGNILDQAIQAGASRIDNVSFVAEDDAISAAQQDALRDATQDAQQQANTVLYALGLTPEEIVNIQINSASTPPPRPISVGRTDALAAEFDATTPVVGGEQTVRAQVTLQISY